MEWFPIFYKSCIQQKRGAVSTVSNHSSLFCALEELRMSHVENNVTRLYGLNNVCTALCNISGDIEII